MLNYIKKNYGWLIVAVIASLPFLPLFGMLQTELANRSSSSLIYEDTLETSQSLAMLYHISGEFSIRWMTAVLSLTPFYILFGVTNLFVRQAMGIATATWSLLHFAIFIWAEGILETFTQTNYIAGLIAVLILIPLLITTNRKSMRFLKSKWKKLQSLAYLAILLSLVHVALLEKTWAIYAIIVGIGFILRIPSIKNTILRKRQKNNLIG